VENRQHRRPLWIGLLACALAPTILLVMGLVASGQQFMIPIEVVLVVSLPASLLATCLVAWPYALWLRHRHKLSSLRICLAGTIVGALVLASFNFYLNWFPDMRDHSFAFQVALTSARKGLIGGALIGLVASAALSVGAGIPIRRIERAQQDSI